MKIERGSTPLGASNGNEDKNFLTSLSITDLITILRTAVRRVDYDGVEEVLVEKENKLKAEIKELAEKLELETLVRLSAEEECKARYERLLESSKNNNELDHKSIAELRIQNIKLEDEKRKAESMAESWKRKFEELSERLLMVEKGVNSFMDADTSPSQGKTDDCRNAPLAVDDEARQSPEAPNTAVLGVSEATAKNAVDTHDRECGNTAADTSPQGTTDDSRNADLAVADDVKQSLDTPNTVVPSATGVSAEDTEKQENIEVDIDHHECGNIAADTSPPQGKTDDCRNTDLTVDDDGRQSPDTPNTGVRGASANTSLGPQKDVIEIKDSDDDGDECIASGAVNGTEATGDIAATVDDIGRSSFSTLLESVKRKWFPKAGNPFDGLNKNPVDVSDTDDDSSSSTSSLGSRINEIKLPSNFLCSIGSKRRKT